MTRFPRVNFITNFVNYVNYLHFEGPECKVHRSQRGFSPLVC